MWFEQLQDKLAQVKDSRAALDVLRLEHQEKMRRQAEELERQRQMQMAHKLDIMRKKKQEYLQYQRQLALQRISEQEREMQMRQEQQKALYQMGGGVGYPYIPPAGQQAQQASPIHQMGAYGIYGYQQMPQCGGYAPQGGAPPQQHNMPPTSGYNGPGGMQAPGAPPMNMPQHMPPQAGHQPQHHPGMQQHVQHPGMPQPHPGHLPNQSQTGQFIGSPQNLSKTISINHFNLTKIIYL